MKNIMKIQEKGQNRLLNPNHVYLECKQIVDADEVQFFGTVYDGLFNINS